MLPKKTNVVARTNFNDLIPSRAISTEKVHLRNHNLGGGGSCRYPCFTYISLIFYISFNSRIASRATMPADCFSHANHGHVRHLNSDGTLQRVIFDAAHENQGQKQEYNGILEPPIDADSTINSGLFSSSSKRTNHAHTRKKGHCLTPGCLYDLFHNGGHSFENEQGKRKRCNVCTFNPNMSTRELSEGACQDKKYRLSKPKWGHRAVFAYSCQGGDLPVLYLDSKMGYMTTYLLSMGFPKVRLCPVNYSSADASSIAARTGVTCIVADIVQLVLKAPPMSYQGIWFDFMGTFNGILGGVDASRVTRAATCIMFTFNARGSRSMDAQQLLYNEISVLPGVVVHEHGTYRGTGGKLNMVYLLALNEKPNLGTRIKESESEPLSESVESEEDQDPYSQRLCVNNKSTFLGAVVMVPLSRYVWMTDAEHAFLIEKYKVVNKCLQSTVLSFTKDALVLGYILKKTGRAVPDQRQIEKKMPTITPSLALSWMKASGSIED